MRHLTRHPVWLFILFLFIPATLAQDATNTPFIITATPAEATGMVTLDTNLWHDPLVRDSTPVTSIASGTNVILLGINPGADRYRIRAYGDTYWITVDALQITGGMLNLPVITEVEPTAVPTSVATTVPTPAPTFTLAPALFLRGEPMGYGAHIMNVENAMTLDVMRDVEMDWLKVRLEYVPDETLNEAIQLIDSAHAAGFKILLTVVGDAETLRREGDIYISAYVDDLANMAEFGADAIEVWEMPNLVENWVEGNVSGRDYVLRMLIPAYRVIKARNPRTVVISAALRPLHPDDAIPGERFIDERYLQDFMNSRGTQFVDCIGVQYVAGRVAPNRTSGDVRGNHYTFYFTELLQRYRDITQSRTPFCFTSFGYAVNTDRNDVPKDYAWADKLSDEDRAAWHSIARNRADEMDDVMLLIVENMDRNDTGDYLDEAYAIMDTEGNCATCDVLRAGIEEARLPFLRLTDGTNIRAGAALDFNPPLSSARADREYRVYAVNPTGDWVKIQYGADDEQGWVQLRFGTLSGSLQFVPIETGPDLPEATITPVPRPTNTPTPTPTTEPTATEASN